MKKMILAVVLAFCSAFALFAGDAEDVKNVILQTAKDAAALKWERVLSHYTEDCKIVDSNGDTSAPADLKEMMILIDGSHPYEFSLFAYKQNEGQEPNAEAKKLLKETSRTQEFLADYKNICTFFKDKMKKCAELELKTTKFLDVKVNGALATVTYTAQSFKDLESDEIITEITVSKLKKVNGVWKIYEEVDKKK